MIKVGIQQRSSIWKKKDDHLLGQGDELERRKLAWIINQPRPINIPQDITLAAVITLIVIFWFLESEILLNCWNICFLCSLPKVTLCHPAVAASSVSDTGSDIISLRFLQACYLR